MNVDFRLLETFRSLFDGKKYEHRNSTLGDFVAGHLYEDLFSLGRSPKLVQRVRAGQRVLNASNRAIGKKARRGDGTFGEVVPAAAVVHDLGYAVARGPLATIEIGTETKIMCKAMVRQIDRVIGDLVRQVEQFQRSTANVISVGIVGLNYARQCTSYEGTREYPTTGSGKHLHPYQEAPTVEQRLLQDARPRFDEFLVLRFDAGNALPYRFAWINQAQTELEYGAALTRISVLYESRF